MKEQVKSLLSSYLFPSRVLGGSTGFKSMLFPSTFPAAGAGRAALKSMPRSSQSRAALLSYPWCYSASSPRTCETINTLLEVILKGAINLSETGVMEVLKQQQTRKDTTITGVPQLVDSFPKIQPIRLNHILLLNSTKLFT